MDQTQKEFVIDGGDFIEINGRWLPTRRERIVIDYDKLRQKKRLSNHESYERLMIEQLLNCKHRSRNWHPSVVR